MLVQFLSWIEQLRRSPKLDFEGYFSLDGDGVQYNSRLPWYYRAAQELIYEWERGFGPGSVSLTCYFAIMSSIISCYLVLLTKYGL